LDIVFGHAPFEKPNDVTVVGILGEAEASAIMHKFFELFRLVFAKVFDFHLLLLLFNISIFLGLRSSRKTLPWEGSFQKVKEHVANSLKIVSSRLLISYVSVDTGISSSSSEILAISERNVLSI